MSGYNDAEGWKRGVGPYSKNYAKFTDPSLNDRPRKLDEGAIFGPQTEQPGPVSRGGPPRYAPKTAKFSEARGLGGQRVKGR